MKFISRPLLRASSARYAHRAQRHFAILATHTSFPATLIRYSSTKKSDLFSRATRQTQGGQTYEDAVEVSANGLVGLQASNNWTCRYSIEMPIKNVTLTHVVSNGALFMPNTFNMQELIRNNYDQYIEMDEAGKAVEPPLIYTVLKGTYAAFYWFEPRLTLPYLGTPIPSSLMLLHEADERFSLQPSRQMSLEGQYPTVLLWTTHSQPWI